ncbi:hypothetical protein ANFP_09730 [Acidithiobacillus ferrooxidans]|nr:hypothetical protein ANFP_09730 [Acidithiobacillus ferrooxidans]
MHPMLRAHHTGYAGVEIGFMLKEIHVPPGMFTGVMYRTLLTTDGASKATALGKVDVQIQALLLHLEGHIVHQPRRYQP